jgi:hypothetical protein
MTLGTFLISYSACRMHKQLSKILEADLYVGVSGVDLQFDHMDLGDGLRLSKTDAHLLAPYMMVFNTNITGGEKHSSNDVMSRDEDGSTWVNVTKETKLIPGHMEYAITAELVIPRSAASKIGEDPIFLTRWVVSLLRMWSAPTVSVPVISNKPFSVALRAEDDEALILPFEIQARGIHLETEGGRSISRDRVLWVKDSWRSGVRLANEHKELRLAVEALDQAHFVKDWALGVLLVWAALEGLFSPARSELRFRVSALISSFLEPSGTQRRLLHNRIAKLYDARSMAAHERSSIDRQVLLESMELLRILIIKMISASHVPSKDELEAFLFGG